METATKEHLSLFESFASKSAACSFFSWSLFSQKAFSRELFFELNYGLVNEIEVSENKEALIVLAGTITPFISTLAVRNVSSTNVQVVRVSFSANDLANQNVRSFSLELQEV